MTGKKSLFNAMVAGGLLVFLAGCAGGPVKHPNRHIAKEHLSEAQEQLSQNHPLEAIDSVKEALKRHRLADDFKATIEDMNRLGHLYSMTGNTGNALLWIRKALVLESVSHHPVQHIETLLIGAEALLPEGQPFSWLKDASEKIDLLKDNPEERDRLMARYRQIQGLSFSEQKQYASAIDSFTSALHLDRKRSDSFSVATDLANLGRNYYLQKSFDKALVSFKEAYSIDHELDHSVGTAFDLEGISLVQAQKGMLRDSARSMLEASGLQMGLGRSEAAKKDIAYTQTILSQLDGASGRATREVLDHWFDDE